MNQQKTRSADLATSEKRLQSLLRLSQTLAEVASPNEVYERVLGESLDILGARAIALIHVQEKRLEIVAHQSHHDAASAALKNISLGSHHPVTDVIRSKTALYFHTARERTERYPELETFFNPATNASAYVPLLLEGEALGVLTLSFATEQAFEEATQAFVTTLASICAQALNRALLFEKTRRSEEKFRELFENTLDAVLMANAEAEIIAANRAAETLFGYTNAELVRLNVPDLFDESELPRLATINQQHDRYEEWSLKHKDGHLLYVEMNCPTFPDGHSQAVIRDISARKKAELERERLTQQLETEKIVLDTILQTAPIGFTFLDNELRYVRINETLADMNGVSVAGHLGRTIAEVVPDLAPKVMAVFQDVLQSGQSVSFELMGETAKQPGVARHWFENIYRVDTPAGETLGVSVMVQEITERKRAENHAKFLAELSTSLRYLTRPDDIEYLIVKNLGEYLGATNCNFSRVELTEGQVFVAQQWGDHEANDFTGSYRLEDFMLPELIIEAQAGLSVVVNNVTRDPRTSPHEDNFAALGIAAILVVPYLKEGVWTGTLTLSCRDIHTWRSDEIALVEDVLKQFYPVLERIRTETDLRESEDRYRTLFTSIDEGFCVIELLFDATGQAYDYRFLEVNPMFEHLTGLKGALGKTVKELVPGLEPHWFQTYGRVATTGESVRFVNEARALDNRWFEVYASRVGGQGSHKVAIIFNDITERNHAETALRDSEEKLRMVLESATEYAIVTTDVRGCVTSWNVGAERLLGFAESDSVGQDVAMIFTPEDRADNIPRKEMETALVMGRAADNRWHLKKDGTRFWATGTLMPLRDSNDTLQGFLKIMRDRSEERKSEQALLESEARLSLTVQAGNLGIWDSDLLTRKTYWSPEQERLFGLEAGTFNGEFSKHVVEQDRMRVLRRIATVKATGETYEDEFRILTPDGSLRWLAGKGRVIRDGTGQAARLIGVNFDITERKQKELNSQFLLELNRTVRTLSDADKIEQTVSTSLGKYLQVTNCNFSTVDVTKDWLEVQHNYQSDDTVKLEGSYKLSDFVAPEFVRHYQQGESITVSDVTEDIRTQALIHNIATLRMRSLLVVPYLEEGRWIAALNISCAAPRQWRKDEIELAETVAAQFIPAMKRARTEAVATLLGERFKQTETSAKSFLYEWDVASQHVWRSSGLETVTGFRPEDIPDDARWWNARIHPDDFEAAMNIADSVLVTGGEYSTQYRVRTKDDSYVYLWDRGRVTLDEHGHAQKLLGTSTDISGQKRLEYALATTAARLDATISFLPLGFCLLSSDYRYIRINSTLADINGLSVEDHLGKRVPEILPYVWKMIEPILKQIELTGEPALNIEVKHPSNARTWLVSYYPVPDADGSLLGFGSVALEITERQQTLNALRETNIKLRDLSERQQRFVADAAHELRAPLTSVRGNLDLLTRYQDIPKDEQREMLVDLQQEAVRLSTLVEDLLELARSDSGLKIKQQPVNLTEVLVSTWHKIQDLNTSHTFELENTPTLYVTGDGDRLKQLALILLENATKYTPAGGTISLGLARNKSDALFYVRDTGIGIAREDLAHVFERFYRTDKARTRAEDPGGTGLGLAIAEWIVTEHGGKVWLESEPGKGTTAFVQIPLQPLS